MVYVPTGMFATADKMRMLLAECPTLQELLGVDMTGTSQERIDEAMEKIATYGTAGLGYPCVLINDGEVNLVTDTMGSLIDVQKRDMDVWISFHVPDGIAGITTVSDERAWVCEQFSAIMEEVLARTGRGESIPGHSHILVERPMFAGVDRMPFDERDENSETDEHPELPLWFGAFSFEVH